MRSEAENLLITGGQGNLGSWLSRYFLRQGREVSILTRRARPLPGLEGAERICCDITDASAMREALRGRRFGQVLHLASWNEIRDEATAGHALQVNALGTRHLLKALEAKPPELFVYFSTFQVYGTYAGHITEAHPPAPRNDYALTHWAAEEYVRMQHRQTGQPHLILRLTNSYGCPIDTQTSKWYLLLNDLSRQAVESGRLQLRSNGLAQRDFIWMGDVCRITEALLAQPAAHNRTLNLSRGRSLRLREVAAAVQRVWRRRRGEELPLELSETDTARHDTPLRVDHGALGELVPLRFHDRLEAEAGEIMELAGRL